MTNDDALAMIADALTIDRGALRLESKATDFSESWDSVGTMNLMLALNEMGVQLAPGQADSLDSVQGILSILRNAGKLS